MSHIRSNALNNYNLQSTSSLTTGFTSQRVGADTFLCPRAITGYINLNYSDVNIPNSTMTVYIFRVSVANSLTNFATGAVQLFSSSFAFTPALVTT